MNASPRGARPVMIVGHGCSVLGAPRGEDGLGAEAADRRRMRGEVPEQCRGEVAGIVATEGDPPRGQRVTVGQRLDDRDEVVARPLDRADRHERRESRIVAPREPGLDRGQRVALRRGQRGQRVAAVLGHGEVDAAFGRARQEANDGPGAASDRQPAWIVVGERRRQGDVAREARLPHPRAQVRTRDELPDVLCVPAYDPGVIVLVCRVVR
jgi:hypothetical protein